MPNFLQSHIIQVLPVRTVHVHPNFQQLDDITAVLFQDSKLCPQDPAEFECCDAIIDMAGELMQDRCGQLFGRAGVGYFSRRYPGDFLISQIDYFLMQLDAI